MPRFGLVLLTSILSLVSFLILNSVSMSLSVPRVPIRCRYPSSSSTRLFYSFYPGKKSADGEKQDPKRLLKNILFPGIYTEYEDTKEAKKTIKVQTKQEFLKSRNEGASFQSMDAKGGSYNMVDASKAYASEYADKDKKKTPLKAIKVSSDFMNSASTVKPSGAAIPVGGGLSVLPGLKPSPSKPLILYEYEGSADCKRVREACALLDLTVEIRPCPGTTSGFSDQMSTVTLGKREVPCVADPNPAMYRPTLFGVKEIIPYLFKTYGSGESSIPNNIKGSGGGLFGGGGGKGSKIAKNARPDTTRLKPIILYGFEGAPYYKPVREVLSELALPHMLINVANGSRNRAKLTQKTGGVFSVPYISDPNTGVNLFDSASIVKYLQDTYTV